MEKITGLGEQVKAVFNVIYHIGKDMIEPLYYLPLGLLAGVLFLVLEKFWRKDTDSDFASDKARWFDVEKPRWVLFFCIIYGIVVMNLTFFSRAPGTRIGVTFEMLGTWGSTAKSHAYFIENILLFIPFGILLPCVFPLLKKLRFCILAGFLFSVCLELMQLVTGRGFCQLDDVLTNTLGAGIGWGCYKLWIWWWESDISKD